SRVCRPVVGSGAGPRRTAVRGHVAADPAEPLGAVAEGEIRVARMRTAGAIDRERRLVDPSRAAEGGHLDPVREGRASVERTSDQQVAAARKVAADPAAGELARAGETGVALVRIVGVERLAPGRAAVEARVEDGAGRRVALVD